MKRIAIFVLFVIITINLNAQTTLFFDTHVIKPPHRHLTQTIENINPGVAGKDVIWDFSGLKCSKDVKETTVNENKYTKGNDLFPFANTIIADGENKFYFQVEDNTNKLLGFTTKDAIVRYNAPIVKMKYPFYYGDSFSCDFSGEGLYYGTVHSYITGTYTAKADAYGTIILPGNISLSGVLRVKTVTHTYETTCKTFEFINTKYLWYTKNSRYPVFVILISKKIEADSVTISNTAYYTVEAYSESAEMALTDNLKYNISVSPNPFSEYLKISYSLNKPVATTVEIIDNNGRLVERLIDNIIQDGQNSVLFNAGKQNLPLGIYYVRFVFDNKIIVRKIVLGYR